MEGSNLPVSGDEHGYAEVRKAYRRASTFSRAASIAFWIISVAFLLWAIPFFPWGMSLDDYSPQVLLGLVLLSCCPAVTAISLMARSRAAQRREALVAWAAIYDRATGLRNREFFLERLKLQCDLGRELPEYRTGLILLTIEERPADGSKPQIASDDVFRRVSGYVARQLRPNDLLAGISGTEMAVLVSEASPAALHAVASRIEHSLEVRLAGLAGEAASRLFLQIGCAPLDDSATEPEMVLESARSALRPVRLGSETVTAA